MLSNEWRDEAMRRFPQFAESISRADTPYFIWKELTNAFERAYTDGDEALIGAIYAYAGWCCRQPPGASPEDDLGTCVACCLFEDIPTMPKALRDMPRWWKLDDVVSMKPIFSYHAGAEGYAQILARFAEEEVTSIKRIEWELEG